jgi:hypothetical protein
MVDFYKLLNVGFPLLLGMVVQGIFLSLPVNLKNWDEDLLSVFTYVGFQGLAAGVIFILFPRVLGVFQLNVFWTIAMVGGVCFLATFRTLKLIPLENTYPILPVSSQHTLKLNFSLDFNDLERMRALSELDYNNPYEIILAQRLKGSLLRIENENKKSVLEEMVIKERMQ